MALETFKCESCGAEFAMDTETAEDAYLSCPRCGEDIEFEDDDEDDAEK